MFVRVKLIDAVKVRKEENGMRQVEKNETTEAARRLKILTGRKTMQSTEYELRILACLDDATSASEFGCIEELGPRRYKEPQMLISLSSDHCLADAVP